MCTLVDIISAEATLASFAIYWGSTSPLSNERIATDITWNNPAIFPNLWNICKIRINRYWYDNTTTRLHHMFRERIAVPFDHRGTQSNSNQEPKADSCRYSNKLISSLHARIIQLIQTIQLSDQQFNNQTQLIPITIQTTSTDTKFQSLKQNGQGITQKQCPSE